MSTSTADAPVAPATPNPEVSAPTPPPTTGPGSLPANPHAEQVSHFKAMQQRVAAKINGGDPTPAPEPAQAEKPAEKPADLSTNPPADAPADLKPEGAKYAWGELKKENKTLREEREAFTKKEQEANARIQELEKKLEEGSITGKQLQELQQKLEAKEKREEELQRDLAYWDIQKLPAWKTEIEEPYQETHQAMETVAKAYNISMAELEKAIWEPDLAKQDQMMEDLLADVPGNSRRRLENAITNIQALDAKAAAMRKNAMETYHAAQERMKQERETASAREKETWQKAFDAVKSEMVKKHPILQDEAVAKEVFEEASKVDYNSLPPDAKAFAVQAMYLTPKLQNAMQERLDSQEAKIKELTEALERYTKKPGMGSPGPTSPPPSTDPKKPETRDDVESRWKAMQGWR